jgi:3',5'-cyclic AMP phosphodiesterase CpdA
MGGDAVLIAQISDLHIFEPGRQFAGHVDTAALCAAAIDHVNKLDPAPDMVLVTGDLVDSGRHEQYAYLRSILSALRAPVRLLPGNHDDRLVIREIFFADRPATDRLSDVVDLDGLRLVLLDDVIPGSPSGELGGEQLEWLDTLLASEPDLPVIVALHHPPFATGIVHMDGMGLLDAAAFEAVIRRHPQVAAVIAGHLHRPITTTWAGTIAMTAPSVAHQVTLDFRVGAPATFSLEPPAMLLHLWTASSGLVSHVSYIGRYEGPFPFPHD